MYIPGAMPGVTDAPPLLATPNDGVPSDATPPAPLSRGAHLAAIIAYMLLAIVSTWPMLLHFTTEALGEHFSDRTANIWSLWWLRVALFDRHTSPFHTDLLFYPQGTDLYFHILNLPSFVVSLVPHLLFGVTAAYNFSVLFALVLAGYAGFRLVAFLTGSLVAALLAGVITGFNALSLHVLQGQLNILNTGWFILCIEFYLRAMSSGRRRDALVSGLFFGLAVLTQGYFEYYLVVFFALHLIVATFVALRHRSRGEVGLLVRRAGMVLLWSGLVAAIVAGPFLVASIISLQKGQVDPQSDSALAIGKSADLARYFVPPPTHWLFGDQAPSVSDRASTYLGWTALVLAAVGLWQGMRRSRGGQGTRWLWVVVALVGIVVSLGPVLQVGGASSFGGVEIPLPFALLQNLWLFRLISAPERFAYLAYLGVAVLAGYGIAALVGRLRGSRGTALSLGLISLVLLELPLHTRATMPLDTPSSMAAIARDPSQGGVLELPLVQQGWKQARRMLAQIDHGHPITSGYLSRPVVDPFGQACSPFQVFTQYPDIQSSDIVSPTAFDRRAPVLLAQSNVAYIVVYKEEYSVPYVLEPLPASELADLRNLAGKIGTLVDEDDAAAIYSLRRDVPQEGVIQLGSDWYPLERSGGEPFRWINGSSADLCVFSPVAGSASLTFDVTSFATPRTLQVWVGGRMVFDAPVPADGALHALHTPPLQWPKGGQHVRLVAPEGSATPASLGRGNDSRSLSLGFGPIQVTITP